MPKNKVTDLITDQEMTFARLVLAGNLTDQQAAEKAGLNPASAAYTKSKPRVRAYMLEYRAAIQKQQKQQESESQQRQHQARERVLARLWQMADLSPEATRNNITGQMKALTMIVAIEGLIPNKFNTQQKPAPVPVLRVPLESPVDLAIPAATSTDLAASAFTTASGPPTKPWDPAASLADNLAALSGR